MTGMNRMIVISVAALLGGAASSAMAAPQPFCQSYARIAVNQAHQAEAMNLGCAGFRWHNWYEGHYQWCRSTSKASAQSETFVRKRALFGGSC